jgi:hypothetical protein
VLSGSGSPAPGTDTCQRAPSSSAGHSSALCNTPDRRSRKSRPSVGSIASISN